MAKWKAIFLFLACLVWVVVMHHYHTGTRFADADIKETPRPKVMSKAAAGHKQCSQTERVRLIEEVCHQRHANKTWKSIDDLSDEELKSLVHRHFVCSEDDKVIGCVNYKAAAGTWLAILKSHIGPKPRHMSKRTGFRKLTSFNASEIRYRLKNYFKFTNVRHPLDRLVSIYNAKLKLEVEYRKKLAPRILKKYRHNVSRELLREGIGVTFEEFLRYIIDGGRDVLSSPHWHSQLSRCHPCFIGFDFISKLDTMANDVDYVVQNKLVGHNMSIEEHLYRPWDRHGLPHFGRKLPEYKSIPDALFDAIIDKYKWDMKTYGYTFTRQNGTVFTECNMSGLGGGSCC